MILLSLVNVYSLLNKVHSFIRLKNKKKTLFFIEFSTLYSLDDINLI